MSGNEGLVDGITLAEHRRMLDAAPSQRDWALVRLLWLSAGRLGEIVNFQRRQISVETLEILPQNLKRPKGPDGQPTVEFKPLSLKAHEIAELVEYCEANRLGPLDYLFPGRRPGSHLTERRARDLFYATAKAAGVMRVSLRTGTYGPAWPHTSRHGVARHLLRNGVGLAIVQKRLGHTQIANTMRYLLLDTGDQRRDLETVEL